MPIPALPIPYELFGAILADITLPIVAIMALGYGLQGTLKLDIGSLNRVQLYVVAPAAILHFLSAADVPLATVWPTAWFTVGQFFVLVALGYVLARIMGIAGGLAVVTALCAGYANSGYFGIPLAQLAFPPEYLLHQAVIMSLHTVLIASVGVALFAGRGADFGAVAKTVLYSPLIWSVIIAVALKGFEIRLPELIALPIKLIAGAFTPLALFTSGCQLYGAARAVAPGPMVMAVFLRLLIAPGLTWVAAKALGFSDMDTAFLVVAASAPIGMLLVIFSTQYRAHPENASAAVFVSTALSPLVVTAWVLVTRLYLGG